MGLGGFVTGQLGTSLDLSLAQMFVLIGITTFTMALGLRIIYRVFAQSSEDSIVSAKAEAENRLQDKRSEGTKSKLNQLSRVKWYPDN